MPCGTCQWFALRSGRAWHVSPLRWTHWRVIALAGSSDSMMKEQLTMCQCVNRITLIGFIGDAPELRFSPKGTPVGTFSLAVNERWKDQEGVPRERAEWFKIVALYDNLWVKGPWKTPLRGKVPRRDFPTALGNPASAAGFPLFPPPRLRGGVNFLNSTPTKRRIAELAPGSLVCC